MNEKKSSNAASVSYALGAVTNALEALTKDEAERVIRAAAILLNVPLFAVPKPVTGGTIPSYNKVNLKAR